MNRLESLRRVTSATAVLRALVLTFVSVAPAHALGLRASVTQYGDFAVLGNTLAQDCDAAVPVPVVGTVGDCGSNTDDLAADVYWRSDSPLAGQAVADSSTESPDSRSTAVLSLPPGAVVTHAFLYWSASQPVADTEATLEHPGSFTVPVLATDVATTAASYRAVADVTAIVREYGVGAYRVADVDGPDLFDQASPSLQAGWWMVVLYERGIDPLRSLVVFDGLDAVASGSPSVVPVAGFVVPPALYSGKIAATAFGGHHDVTGDSLTFGALALSNARNPVDDVFNSSRTFLGAAVSSVGDLPQLTGTEGSHSGMDIDVFDVTGGLTPGQTSASIVAASTGDAYELAAVVTSISTVSPLFSGSTKVVTDLNGGDVEPGDVLQYTITVANTGNDAAVGTVLVDEIPTGLTYLPDSIAVDDVARTDLSGDDEAEYEEGLARITARLGTGADAVNGGLVAIASTVTVRFSVTVDPQAAGLLENQASITAAGQLGAPAQDWATDGDPDQPGAQPTVVDVLSPLVSCPSTPRLDCAAPGVSKLSFSGKASDPSRQKLSWKWAKAAADEFGNPVDGDSNYKLCLYDDDALVMAASLLPGGTCGAKPCWSAAASGALKYTNKAGEGEGLTKVKLKAGATGAALVKGGGAALSLPFPVTDAISVTVQLLRGPGEQPCVGATYPAPAKKNDPVKLKFAAKIP